MIRQALFDDIPKLMDLKATVGRDTYFNMGTAEEFEQWETQFCSMEYFQEKLDEGAVFLVAEYRSELLGMSCLEFFDDYAYFSNLYIGLQCRGIGSLLTQHRMELVKSHISLKPQDIEFEVRARTFYNNFKAYQHILKHGFRPVSWQMHEVYPFPTILFSQVLGNSHLIERQNINL